MAQAAGRGRCPPGGLAPGPPCADALPTSWSAISTAPASTAASTSLEVGWSDAPDLRFRGLRWRGCGWRFGADNPSCPRWTISAWTRHFGPLRLGVACPRQRPPPMTAVLRSRWVGANGASRLAQSMVPRPTRSAPCTVAPKPRWLPRGHRPDNDTIRTATDNSGTGGDSGPTRRDLPACRRHTGPRCRATSRSGFARTARPLLRGHSSQHARSRTARKHYGSRVSVCRGELPIRST